MIMNQPKHAQISKVRMLFLKLTMDMGAMDMGVTEAEQFTSEMTQDAVCQAHVHRQMSARPHLGP